LYYITFLLLHDGWQYYFNVIFHHSQTATQALELGEIYGFALHFRYSLHDAHQAEYFELRLIFGFEQSSFGCRKKPSLTSLLCTTQYNTAQNRPENFLSCPPDDYNCSDDVYLRERGQPPVLEESLSELVEWGF